MPPCTCQKYIAIVDDTKQKNNNQKPRHSHHFTSVVKKLKAWFALIEIWLLVPLSGKPSAYRP